MICYTDSVYKLTLLGQMYRLFLGFDVDIAFVAVVEAVVEIQRIASV